MSETKKVYAVRKGAKIGVFNTWAECQKQIKGYSGAEYKGFTDIEEAKKYMDSKKLDIELKEREELNEDEIIAYVDGSYEDCLKTYGSGIVILHAEKKLTFSKKGTEDNLLEMRNVAGEIGGARFAMEYALKNNIKRVYLYYDYEGIEKWCNGAWKASKPGTMAYKQFYDDIESELEVVFAKVKAHTGDLYNEEADKLAKKAVWESQDVCREAPQNELENNLETEFKSELKRTIVKNGVVNPILNIVMDNKVVTLDDMNLQFKESWKKKGKNLKDIKEVEMVFNSNKRVFFWNVITEDGVDKIVIEL